MKYYTLLISVALAASLLSGCSKHPSADGTKPIVVALGEVQVSDGGTNRIDIGDGRSCIVRSYTSGRAVDPKDAKYVDGRIAMIISVEQKLADGSSKVIISDFTELASPGQTVGCSNSQWSFSITPKLKQ